jgi:phosphoglycerol transferase MdoB-like AlkP superfamily enzyme
MMLVVYTLLRAGFLIANLSFFTNVTATEIALCFLYGVKYDISALLIINAPVILLYLVPVNITKFRWYRQVVFILFSIINLAAIFVNLADYRYFPTIERRLLYEPYTMFPDISRMLPGLVVHHYMLFLIFIASSAAFIYVVIRVNRMAILKKEFTRRLIPRIAVFIVTGFFVILGIRGGFQLKPLRTANAFTSGKINLGYLTLNTTYTVMSSYFQPLLPEMTLLPENESKKIVRDLLCAEDEQMLDTAFAFLRVKKTAGEFKKNNVVIFIMESWSASHIGSITGGKTLTPFFDSLSSAGVLFTNFYASGQRSIEGIPSILASLPAVYSHSIIGSISEVYRFRGLGSILSEQGYSTSFHHGGSTGTMGFDAFSRIAGFKNYYGRESYPGLADSLTDGSWGICDEPFFLETGKVLNSTKEPFCAAIFSLSSHDPYTIPKFREPMFEQFKDEAENERAIRYSDFSLRQFFAEASKSTWFQNTTFVITADHTEFAARNNFYTTFHVPLLIYSPAILGPGKVDKTASHTDILPAILDLLNIPAVHSSMGFSALNSSRERYAFVKYASFYGIISNNYVLLNDLEHTPALYEIKTDPSLTKEISAQNPETVTKLNQILKAYLQETTHAIGENLIYK